MPELNETTGEVIDADRLLAEAFIHLSAYDRAVLEVAKSWVLPALKLRVEVPKVKDPEKAACIWATRLAEKLLFSVMPEDVRDRVIAARSKGQTSDFSKLAEEETP